jgi:hypothetical protein
LWNWPDDLEPVVIDFGVASVKPPDYPKEETWGYRYDEVVEMRKVLTAPDNGDWHVASPYKQYSYERQAAVFGCEWVNARIESLPAEVREIQFERIPGTGVVDARTQALQWRVRLGVRTQDDYLEATHSRVRKGG